MSISLTDELQEIPWADGAKSRLEPLLPRGFEAAIERALARMGG